MHRTQRSKATLLWHGVRSYPALMPRGGGVAGVEQWYTHPSTKASTHHSPFSCSISTTCLKPSTASRGSSPSSMPEAGGVAEVPGGSNQALRVNGLAFPLRALGATRCMLLGRPSNIAAAIHTLGVVILVFDVDVLLFGLVIRVLESIVFHLIVRHFCCLFLISKCYSKGPVGDVNWVCSEALGDLLPCRVQSQRYATVTVHNNVYTGMALRHSQTGGFGHERNPHEERAGSESANSFCRCAPLSCPVGPS